MSDYDEPLTVVEFLALWIVSTATTLVVLYLLLRWGVL